ncbi:MAG: protein kinase [Isosphaeraceae bacterium]
MALSTSGRTWDEASSPPALGLARRFEAEWRAGHKPDLEIFLAEAGDRPGARLALLRAEMGLRWEDGERPPIASYRTRFPDLTGESLVALIYEEFCLKEEAGEEPDVNEYLRTYPEVAGALRRVLDIHGLVGSGTSTMSVGLPSHSGVAFPKAGETIAGFRLVEELGRGAFARVFRAEERQLADRPVALKVARTGSREPETLARLQHTHIVPVHSYRTDPATGLHLLCMPYFGRVTLARLLADSRVRVARSGAELVEALDRLGANEPLPVGRSAGRAALGRRDYAQAIAWWGARMAEALEHAHDHGVLHRDVKPSNVLVTRDGLPMLLDFNLARRAASDQDPADEGLPGGTLDYMSPEHLEELAEGQGDRVDARSDVYGLGVLLFEALVGSRPFVISRNVDNATEMLLSAAQGRRAGPPRLRDTRPDVPAALEAVVLRCLQPDPDDRYASAADLAIDLQAVADDQPLRFAREPWVDRAYRFSRRHRRVLFAMVPLLLAVVMAGVMVVRDQLDRSRTAAEIFALMDGGMASEEAGDFDKAMVQFEAAARLAERPDARELGRRVIALRRDRPLGVWSSLDELRHQARQRFRNAQRTGEVRSAADALFAAAEPLRFRLTGFSGDIGEASKELIEAVRPFFVFGKENWLDRPDLKHLDPARLDRLRRDVNELLFLWAIALDREAELDEAVEADDPSRSREALTRALEVCDRALTFASPREPWVALQSHLKRRVEAGRDGGNSGTASADVGGNPAEIEGLSSLACFEWGTLRLRQGRAAEAVAWLRQAVRLEPSHYWYQYALAYAYDQTPGDQAEALRHYDLAVALKPDSPWVRFSRARIYRARGAWPLAVDDLQFALRVGRASDGRPIDPAFERQTRLELGLVLQSLGDLAGARREYGWVIASDPSGDYAHAARLNRAKLDADDGETARAFDEYEALVKERPRDPAARRGRALLGLRIGRYRDAEADLTRLVEGNLPATERAESLAFRALARLIQGRPREALADADAAYAVRPRPWFARLRTRAQIALARPEGLVITDPAELDALPVNGESLRADLLRLRDRLMTTASTRRPPAEPDDGTALRTSLALASVLSALGDQPRALREAEQAVALSPLSAQTHLLRAEIERRAGRNDQAAADVEKARYLEPNNPKVWEARGVLHTRLGEHTRALADFGRALELGDETPQLRRARAASLAAANDPRGAITDWSAALSRDPEDPSAYLGRAEALIRLRQWDAALADLEQSAGWSDGRPGLMPRLVLAYLRCVPNRPGRLPRLIAMLSRLVAVPSRIDAG